MAAFLSGVMRLFRPRATVALENLRSVYHRETERRHREILRGCYDHIAWVTAEYFALVSDPAQIRSWVGEVRGQEILDRALSDGHGAVLLGGHMGNWECLAAWLAQCGYPMRPIIRHPNSKSLADLLRVYRARVGVGTFPKEEGFRKAVRFVKDGGFLGVMPDQAWDRGGAYGPFLGRMCYTATGPAVIARMTGAPVIPIVLHRIAPFQFRVTVSPPLELATERDREGDIAVNTMKINAALEEMIRPFPDQWLWLHRRWKEPRD